MRRRAANRERVRAIVPVLLFLCLAAAVGRAQNAGEDPEDWASSPEAYFLTAQERAEWRALDSRDSRERFRERYWLKRDPSPGSGRNEFRELVLGRIRTADSRFRIQKTPGSRTARGLVFIVLGTPARVVDQAAPPPPPEAGPGRRLGATSVPVASNEGNETTSTWYYEPQRTPRILELLGRPTLQVRIVVEPSRRMDSIQDPGLFNDMKEIVARRSIVNPDLVPPDAPGEVFPAENPAPPRQTLSPAVRDLLAEASPAFRAGDRVSNASAIFHESGGAEGVLWIFAPAPVRRASFHGIVRSSDGKETAVWSEEASASPAFSAHGAGAVFARRVPLPPGSYDAAVALTDDAGAVLASGAVPLRIPPTDSGFGVSSVLLTRGPAPAAPETDPTFVFGATSLPLSADAVFPTSQSLWYFVEVAHPSDPAKVTLEARLRRGSEPVAALAPFSAKLQPIGEGRYLAGIELPLSTLGAGDYVLYLQVRDAAGSAREELRRADFRVVP